MFLDATFTSSFVFLTSATGFSGADRTDLLRLFCVVMGSIVNGNVVLMGRRNRYPRRLFFQSAAQFPGVLAQEDPLFS